MFLPDQPRIETAHLTIRLVEAADLPSVLAINADDDVTRYLPYPTWTGSTDAQAWYERAMQRLAAREAGQFVIEQRDSGRVIGTCLLFHFDVPSARAEIGYVLAQEFWGAGHMLEAMKAFVSFAFERVGLRRLEAEIDPRNLGSARLLARLGFVEEGLLRQRWALKGEVTDSRLYGLLRMEWSAS